MEELWNLCLHIIQSVDFDTTLLLSELGPPEYVQAQIYGCGVKGIDVTTEFENVGSTLALSFINNEGVFYKLNCS